MGADPAGTDHEFELAARLAAIVESSNDAILGKTLDGVITSWNAGAARMYGYAPEEIIGQNVAILIPPDRRDELGPILDRLRRGEQVPPFETKRLCKDGAVLDVSVCISPILDTRGRVTGASTVARDVTEHNQAEARRKTLEQQLRRAERMETLGQLAGGIAHDFNNLLAAILNYAEFVAQGTADRPRVRSDAEQIAATAARGARLTRQLLLFSRQEPAEPQVLDLNDVLTGLQDLLRTTVSPHIELRITLAGQPATILADRGGIEQVLVNLTVNARDAMPNGGMVRIVARHVDLNEAYARAHPGITPGRYVELTVRDTGNGMPPGVAARIFDPFFTTKPRGDHSGLGLSTVYGIVSQAGGTVTVHTAEGAGSTMRICLPAAAQTPARPAPGEAAAADAGPADAGPADAGPAGRPLRTILVVDDEPTVLAATSRILRQHGYATLSAGSGTEALSLAASHEFQLLLADTVMPGFEGPLLAERIAALKPGLPIVRMSGSDQPPSGGQPGSDQAWAFLPRPFTTELLIRAVRTALATAPDPEP
ncbi:MAG TPA: PAS domain S-box protein [Streptosporangiaceae bacterium]|nr:PAS domain S-box protein [Streptosporangiaceae bacterium]